MNNELPISKGLRRSDPSRPRPLADTVLRMIWEQKRISRAEIARLAGLSRSTVSEIIAEILPTGLVSEIGEGPSRGGRRPIVLEFRDDACVILGVEMGAAHVAVALTDLRGNVVAWETQGHPVRTDPKGTRLLIAELCTKCLASSKSENKPLVGIGVAVPCPFDPSLPDHLSNVVLPDWDGKLGLAALSKELGAPLYVDNDANLGALAEHWWGLGGDADNIAYIKVATGIGSGHIIGNEIYRGATGVAGEIGHISIDPNGKECICGLRGCLVTYVGALGLGDRARELLPEYPNSVLVGQDIGIQDIEEAALTRDPLALKIIREAAGHLGTAVAGMMNLMNPAVVILGGDMSRLGELLLDPLRETVSSRTLVRSVAAADILVSKLGPRSVAVGAATLVLKTCLSDSRVFPTVEGSILAKGSTT
ncbi:MAG: putative NBD/HSP70 family sugar kinase [Candidatus Krumholzibacteriia bacterium]